MSTIEASPSPPDKYGICRCSFDCEALEPENCTCKLSENHCMVPIKDACELWLRGIASAEKVKLVILTTNESPKIVATISPKEGVMSWENMEEATRIVSKKLRGWWPFCQALVTTDDCRIDVVANSVQTELGEDAVMRLLEKVMKIRCSE